MLASAAGSSASITPRMAFNQANISAAQCTPRGSRAEVVVDVTFQLKNWADAADSAQWAIDDVERHSDDLASLRRTYGGPDRR